MTESYKALCTDHYVNQKIAVKMELPRSRETVLDLFERVRKQFPSMASFRRYKDELALESPQTDMPHRWLAIRANTVRSGVVNAPTPDEAYTLHRQILDLAPAYLSISPLDIDFVELLWGFDLAAGGNHDAIVLEALYAGSPLAALLDIPGSKPLDCQPLVGLAVGSRSDTEVYFEVKTRQPSGQREADPGPDPISVYVTVRRLGAVADVKELAGVFAGLAKIGEDLVERRVVPGLIVPIRQAITSGNA